MKTKCRTYCRDCVHYDSFFGSCNLYYEEVYIGEGEYDIRPVRVGKNKRKQNVKVKNELDTLSVTRNKLLDDLWVTEENLKDYTEHFNKASDELDQLKQTLTEIKEICNEYQKEYILNIELEY